MRQFGKVFVISLASLLVIGLIWFSQKDRQVVVADLAPTTVQADRQAAKRVLQANIKATNQGDLAAYLATIAPSKRATTEKELAPTFKQQHTQLNFDTSPCRNKQRIVSWRRLISFRLLKVKPNSRCSKVIWNSRGKVSNGTSSKVFFSMS